MKEVAILLWQSGHKDPITQRVVIDQIYDEAIEASADTTEKNQKGNAWIEKDPDLNLQRLGMYLPMGETSSIRRHGVESDELVVTQDYDLESDDSPTRL